MPVVVKVGSSSLTGPDGSVSDAAITRVVDQVEGLWASARPTVLVTSAAVAAGLPAMGLSERPRDLPGLQVAAAVGQGLLMGRYSSAFGERDRVVGQVLLTRDVLAHRGQYLHAREALGRMLALGVVPIVNENDTVVVDELKLGDNDRLAAIVSHLVGAAMLVILTDTAGLYSGDPRRDDDAELLSAVRHTDAILDELHSTRGGRFGSGGVATKVAAARMAAWSGIPTVIADATVPDVALRAAAGEDVGTWIEPHEAGLTARKLWIAFGQSVAGRVVVDAGAARALIERGKSLLPVGVIEVGGRFDAGSAIEVATPDGAVIGKGLAGMAAHEVESALGQHTEVAGGAVIHRDDLVILV
jgi:glutamate 5-kinase